MAERPTCPFPGFMGGECGRVAGRDGYCIEHSGEKCCACGKQAVDMCHGYVGSFGCAASLCGDCVTHSPRGLDGYQQHFHGRPGDFFGELCGKWCSFPPETEIHHISRECGCLGCSGYFAALDEKHARSSASALLSEAKSDDQS